MAGTDKLVTVALLGAGARGELNLGTLVRERPDLLSMTAVAEPNEARRRRFVEKFGIKREYAFADWRELLERPRFCDALIIALPCRMHYDSCLAALKAGYHVLLEKPMALEPAQCIALARAAGKSGRILAVATQNRFNRIYQRTKQLLEQGVPGRLMSITCDEHIGYWHFILSYVRGIHHHSSLSHSFMMAKGIHDLDLALWLTGFTPSRVASFGRLSFFTPENAPEGAPSRCAEGCPAEPSCQFSALKQYLDPGRPDIPWRLSTGQSLQVVKDIIRHPRYRTMAAVVSPEDISEEGVKRALRETDFGKCVFHCDNNVVDHQTVSVEFEQGATLSFTLSGFSLVWERRLDFHGTKGEIRTADFSGRLETRTFNPARVRRERIPYHGILHGGGDRVILEEFAKAVKTGKPGPSLPLAEESVSAHLLGFAAEAARTENRVVDFTEFKKKAEKEAEALARQERTG